MTQGFGPDIWLAPLVLATLFLLEAVIPFYAGRDQRLRHAGRNLTLAVISGAVASAMTPLVIAAFAFSARAEVGLTYWLGLPSLAAAVTTFVLFDLWMYAWHRMNHRLPFLWRLHRVHHTDPAMDATTAFRFHPGEMALSTLANCFVFVLLGMDLETFLVYKAAMVVVILIHHSNLAVPDHLDRAMCLLLVPPSMHRVHHSEPRIDTDSNYGTLFPYWDRLFGSFRRRNDLEAIRFGIGAFSSDDWQGPLRLLKLPFVDQADARRAS
jgi:sterol desaturase/sphingolipid hydroxylase (fatty acid hydroxylase superfamily)